MSSILSFRQKANVRLLNSNRADETNPDEDKCLEHNEAVIAFEDRRDESYKEQIKLYRNIRKEEVLSMVDKIVDGKRRKLRSNVCKKR